MNHRDAYPILKRIGLNQYESKVYLGLLTKGISSAGDISDIAGVPRSRVYDVLATLEKKGFVNAQNDRPVKYIPVEPQEMLRRLKVDYEKEFKKKQADLDSMAEEISKRLVPIHEKASSDVDLSGMTSVIRGSDNLRRQTEHMILSANKSLHKLTTSAGIVHLRENHGDHIRAAKKKGIPFKIVAHIEEPHEEHARALSKHAHVRHCEGIEGRFLLKDGEEALLIMAPHSSDQEHGLWVKSPYLTSSLQNMFDSHWENGKAF